MSCMCMSYVMCMVMVMTFMTYLVPLVTGNWCR